MANTETKKSLKKYRATVGFHFHDPECDDSKQKRIFTGDEVTQEMLPDGVVIKELVASGHLEEMKED